MEGSRKCCADEWLVKINSSESKDQTESAWRFLLHERGRDSSVERERVSETDRQRSSQTVHIKNWNVFREETRKRQNKGSTEESGDTHAQRVERSVDGERQRVS